MSSSAPTGSFHTIALVLAFVVVTPAAAVVAYRLLIKQNTQSCSSSSSLGASFPLARVLCTNRFEFCCLQIHKFTGRRRRRERGRERERVLITGINSICKS